jgi:hypothetical protein
MKANVSVSKVIDLNEEGAKKLSEEFGEDRVLATGSVNVTDEVGLHGS